MGRRKRRKKVKIIGHWSDPPAADLAVAPAAPSEQSPEATGEEVALWLIYGSILVPLILAPVSQIVLWHVDLEHLAMGVTAGIALIGAGIVLWKLLRRRNAWLLRQADARPVILWGKRLPMVVIVTGLFTLTPSILLWAGITEVDGVEIDLRYLVLMVFVFLMLFDCIALMALLTYGRRATVGATGIRLPDLWDGVLTWNKIASIRIEQRGVADWLLLDLRGSGGLVLSRRPRWLKSSNYDAEKGRLEFPSNVFLAPPEPLLAHLHRRIEEHAEATRMRSAVPAGVLRADEAGLALNATASED